MDTPTKNARSLLSFKWLHPLTVLRHELRRDEEKLVNNDEIAERCVRALSTAVESVLASGKKLCFINRLGSPCLVPIVNDGEVMSSLELRHYLVSITARLSAGLKNNANISDHSAQTDRYYAASNDGVALPQNCQRKVSLTRIIASAHKPTLEFLHTPYPIIEHQVGPSQLPTLSYLYLCAHSFQRILTS